MFVSGFVTVVVVDCFQTVYIKMYKQDFAIFTFEYRSLMLFESSSVVHTCKGAGALDGGDVQEVRKMGKA